MKIVKRDILAKLYKPDKFSHKGQNGKLLIIGGSSLFHGASLWALKTASRIVDMVFYLSIDKNQQYADWLNKQLYDFINIGFDDLDSYVKEADAILLGPGMVRWFEHTHHKQSSPQVTSTKHQAPSTKIQINSKFKISKNNFEDTYQVTKHLLKKYPDKKWVLDAGALQVMEAEWLKKLTKAIVTPHAKEFEKLFGISKQFNNSTIQQYSNKVQRYAREYICTIVLKGPTDIICDSKQCLINRTGNEGMTKGGTGDVLAGLIAALACKNDCFLAAAAGAYICGLAGDELFTKVGIFFNASDLCDQIPTTLHQLIS